MATVTSAYATTASTALTLADWWLKDPIDPTRNMILSIEKYKVRAVEDQATFKPLGRANYIVIGDVVRGVTGNITLPLATAAERAALKVLRNSQRILLLQSYIVGEPQQYIRLDSDWDEEYFNTDPPTWKISIDFAQTDAP